MGNKKSKANAPVIQPTVTKIKKEFKILLLGVSQSGTSTLAKHLRCFADGFQRNEKETYIQMIGSVIISTMNNIVRNANEREEKFDLLPEPNQVKSRFKVEHQIKFTSEAWPVDLVQQLKALWKEKEIKQEYHTKRHKHQYIEGLPQ
jgi:hypothetical protein